MKIIQTPTFYKAVKKLPPQQKKDIDIAVNAIMHNPLAGEAKVGDLGGVYVYKFKMVKQHILLAYSYHDTSSTLTLLALGSHENFYRDMKRSP